MNVATETMVRRVVAALDGLAGVEAALLGGSVGSGLADADSDIDLHVFWRGTLPDAAVRRDRLAQVADAGSVLIGVQSWGLEDHLRIDGRLIELVYVNLDDLEAEVARAYGAGLAAEGYATAFLYSVAHGIPAWDRSGRTTELRDWLRAEFPEPTFRLLLLRMPALLRFYTGQIGTAQRRGDLLFVQHRRYSAQMVFFNLLFALNRQYHPGEKRLLQHAERCPIRPHDLADRWSAIARRAADDPALLIALRSLADDLIALVEPHGGVVPLDRPF